MTTATLPAAPPRPAPPPPPAAPPQRRFATAAALLHFLGDVPPERVILDPLPGTATEADLLRLCEGTPKRLCELIDGTLVEKPVGFWEGRVGVRVSTKTELWAEANGAGAVFGADSPMRMASGRVRLPDVFFLSNERLPTTREKVPTVAPDLAVEVLSESNTRTEMAQKLHDYFDSGTRLVWYIDLRTRTVAVYHKTGEPTRVLGEADALDGEDVLPGFSLPLAEVFRSLPAEAAGESMTGSETPAD